MDTDYAGTMQGFHHALKANGIRLNQISCVMATHYHPDHCGLIGQLQEQGIQLLLMDSQAGAVHNPDYIFARAKREYTPVDPAKAVIISANESRTFLKRLGIEGEILRTASHSEDSVSLILDDGNCFVGDLEPPEYLEAYADNALLAEDWKRMKHRSRRPFSRHWSMSAGSVTTRQWAGSAEKTMKRSRCLMTLICRLRKQRRCARRSGSRCAAINWLWTGP